MAAEVLRGPAEGGTQVGTSDVADEESVAGENGVGFDGFLGEVEDEDGNGFDGVAGGFEDLETKSGEVEKISVFHGDERILGLSSRTEADVRSTAVAEFKVSS